MCGAPGYGVQRIRPQYTLSNGQIGYPTGWGTWRARLEPRDVSGGRHNFYLHNSTKGYTHGCVETCDSLYSRFSAYHDSGLRGIDVLVDYTTNSTNGGTARTAMKSARSLFVFFLVAALPISFAFGGTKSQDCGRSCLVEIDGLSPQYSAGSLVRVSIRNTSKHRLDVNVAIEGLESQSWTEVTGSVSDPQHALSKMLILSPIKAESALFLAFDLCATPMIIKAGDSLGLSEHPCEKGSSGTGVPALLRLRVDVHIAGRQGIQQRVRSREFAFTPGNNSN